MKEAFHWMIARTPEDVKRLEAMGYEVAGTLMGIPRTPEAALMSVAEARDAWIEAVGKGARHG